MSDRKPTTKGKSPAKASAKAKPVARKAKPVKPAKSAKATATKSPVKPAEGHERAAGKQASRLIDQRISEVGGWRGQTLARMRGLILEADPDVTEEWKWMGTPIWSHHGIVCTGETYTKVVKLTFARGASIADPAHLFNSSMEGNTRRAIDIREGEEVDAVAFTALVRAAVARNGEAKKR